MLGPESLLMLHHVNQAELIAELRGRARAAEHGHPGAPRRAASGSRAAVAAATGGLRRWSHRPVRETACEAACVA